MDGVVDIMVRSERRFQPAPIHALSSRPTTSIAC